MMRLIFPTVAFMEGKYRVLVRCRWLLPFCWVARWVDILLHRRKNIARRMQEKDILNEQDLTAYEKNMRTVGMPYHFDE